MEAITTSLLGITIYFAQWVTNFWGEEGAAWLRDLPALLAESL